MVAFRYHRLQEDDRVVEEYKKRQNFLKKEKVDGDGAWNLLKPIEFRYICSDDAEA